MRKMKTEGESLVVFFSVGKKEIDRAFAHQGNRLISTCFLVFLKAKLCLLCSYVLGLWQRDGWLEGHGNGRGMGSSMQGRDM